MMHVPIVQTSNAEQAIAEALRARDSGGDAYEVLSWLNAWSEGWGGDSFDDWDGIEPSYERDPVNQPTAM